MTTIMCFGTFDILHLGHIHYFKQAKKHADTLIVVVARDKTKQDQDKETIFNENERLELIQSVQIVNKAVLGNHENHFKIIEKHKPEIICLGYDHPISEKELAEKLLPFHVFPKIIRAKSFRPENHKTSHIRDFILSKT